MSNLFPYNVVTILNLKCHRLILFGWHMQTSSYGQTGACHGIIANQEGHIHNNSSTRILTCKSHLLAIAQGVPEYTSHSFSKIYLLHLPRIVHYSHISLTSAIPLRLSSTWLRCIPPAAAPGGGGKGGGAGGAAPYTTRYHRVNNIIIEFIHDIVDILTDF